MVFGRYLNVRRVRAGLSLRQVTQKLRISPSYLSQVEQGARPPFGKERWDALIAAVPGVTWEGLLWATMSTTGFIPIESLSRLQRLAVAALLAVLKEAEDLPERFSPEDAPEDFLNRVADERRPTAASGVEEILGDHELPPQTVADTVIALGWRPQASNLDAAVSHLLTSHPEVFVRSGKHFRVRRR